MEIKKDLTLLFNVFVVMLFISLPAVDAVSVSNVNVADVSDRYAVINWISDQAMSSLVVYGRNVTDMVERRSSNALTKNHSVLIAPLFISSNYYFNISSANPNGTATSGIYNFTTELADTKIPFIEAKLPEYHGSTELDVRGRTEPNANVFVEVNGNTTRFKVTDNSGEFFLPAVLLRAGSGKVTPNQVKIISIDPSNNRNEISFTVNVDKTPPGITFDEPVQIKNALLREDRSFAIGQTTFAVKGNSDEPAVMEINAEDEAGKNVFRARFNISSPWQTTVQFPKDGSYTLEFYAVDRAGNVFSERFVVLVDTTPLRIERTNLNDINPSYVPITTVRGRVNKPGAVIVAVVNNLTTPEASSINLTAGRLTNIPTSISELVQRSGYRISTRGVSRRQPLNYVTTADESGNFEIEIELTSEIVVSVQEAESLKYYAGGTWLNHVEIIATDAVGNIQRTGEKKVYYTRCGAGGAFTVSSPTPSPGSLPEPILEAGAGMFSLTMDFAWTGSTDRKDVTINRARITRQQVNREDLLGRYNLTIGPRGLFKGAIVYPRTITTDTNQLYALVNLNPLTRELFPSQIPVTVGQVFGPKLEFPLQLEIDYTYRLEDGTPSPGITQKTCIDVQMQVEPDASHFTRYIPTKLMRSTINAINSTLNFIDSARTRVRQAQTIALVSCGAGIVIQGARLLVNKWVCAGNDARRFLQPGGGCKIKNYNLDGSAVFDCTDITDAARRSLAETCLIDTADTLQWQQYAVDLPCDRIFCPSIPSLKRHSVTYHDLLVSATDPVRQGERSTGRAVDTTHLGGAASKCVDANGNLIRVDNGDCKVEFNRGWRWASVFHFPYSFNNGAYDRALQQEQGNKVTISSVETFFQRVEQEVSNLCTQDDTGHVTYVKSRKKQTGGVETAWRIKPVLKQKTDGDYESVIELWFGEYSESEVIKAEREAGGRLINPTKEIEDTYFTKLADLTDCYDPADGFKCKINAECGNQCDQAVQFGQITSTISSTAKRNQPLPTDVTGHLGGARTKEYSFDPTSSIFNAARAMCFPALDGYLRTYQSLLREAQVCLRVIAETGKGSPGVCSAFLANGVCDLVADAISCLGITAGNLFGSQGVGVQRNFLSVNPFKVITSAGEALSETVSGRYGGTAVYRSFFDQGKLIRSFCIAAFTGDWDLGVVSDLLTDATVTPVRPVCLPAVAQRRFITSDPTKQGKVTYLYHVAGMLTGGAEVTNVHFQLICSADNTCTQYGTSNPGGICDCSKVGEKIQNIPDIPGGVRLGDVLNQEKYYPAPALDYRYDKFRISFNYKNNLGQDVVDKCESPLSQEGFPPAECRLDLDRGGFRCAFTIGDTGTARIVDKPRARIDEETGQDHIYAAGEPEGLALPSKIEVISPDADQPLKKWARYIIKNQIDRVIFDGYKELDEGLHDYDSYPGIAIKQSDFYAAPVAAGAPKVDYLNPSGVSVTEVTGTPSAGNLNFIVLFTRDSQDKLQYYCVGYQTDPVLGDVFSLVPTTATLFNSTLSQINCLNTNIKLVVNDGAVRVANRPGNRDAVSTYQGTSFRISYPAAPQAAGQCTTDEVGWRGEVILYHSTTDGTSDNPSSQVNMEDSSAKFNFKAQCKKTEGTQAAAGAQISLGRVRAYSIAKQTPDQLPIPPYNFTINQSAKLHFSVIANSDIQSIKIRFERESEGKKQSKFVDVDPDKYVGLRNIPGPSGTVTQQFNIPNFVGNNIKVFFNVTLTNEKSFEGTQFTQRININRK